MSDSDSSLMPPGAMCSESPVFAPWSTGSPHSGAPSRGNRTNSSAASGMPCANIRQASATGIPQFDGCGADCGCIVSTISVAPSSTIAGTAASAANIDCP